MFTLMCVLQISIVTMTTSVRDNLSICCCYYWNDAWYKSCARTAMLN
uniref:ORF128b n=1 Tax=Helicoverpa SNPV AC53 TaxID=1569367 RepID=A0A127E5F6_9ABAC|nr:ORF128b [Helicoverpa SNPV AC53]